MVMGEMLGLPMPAFLSIRNNNSICFGYGCYHFCLNIWTSGFKNLLRLAPNMDSLIFIGTAVAYFYSLSISILIFWGTKVEASLYYESAALILVFISLGNTWKR